MFECQIWNLSTFVCWIHSHYRTINKKNMLWIKDEGEKGFTGFDFSNQNDLGHFKIAIVKTRWNSKIIEALVNDIEKTFLGYSNLIL